MAIAYGQLQKTLLPFAKPPSKSLSRKGKTMAVAYSSRARGGGLGGMVQRGRSDWQRMMSGFTQPSQQRTSAGGSRIGSYAARYNVRQRQSVTAGFGQAAERARQANLARKQQIESLYGEMMKRYQPGGAFERRGLGEIERQKTKGTGKEMQQMISSGLFGTTTAAQTGRRWEAEVGAPSRLRLEDIMQQRLTGIQQQKAGFLERIQEPYPDYSALMR